MDFVVDGLATGRMVRILSVVDAYTRECVALEADFSLGSGRVTRVLERAIAERGRPEQVRSDNGPEFTSRRIIGWAEDWKVGLVHIQPGKPMQNGHVESFHGRLRDECLNTSWFRTLNDVRNTLANWRREYNEERPHSSLDYRTPEEFRQTTGYADVESHIRTAPTTAMRIHSQSKTKTGKLQLSVDEKKGAGHGLPAPWPPGPDSAAPAFIASGAPLLWHRNARRPSSCRATRCLSIRSATSLGFI
jgi:putative transposase